MHIEEQRTVISSTQVKLVEASDYYWDWRKYFCGKFHEELRSAKSKVDNGTVGKSYISSHIQIIFAAKLVQLVDEILEHVSMRRCALLLNKRTNPRSSQLPSLHAVSG
ncbi:unnamed protein product [Calypogeia fissa]